MRQFESIVDVLIYASSAVGLLLSIALSIYGLANFPSPLTGAAATLGMWVLLALLPVGLAYVLRFPSSNFDLKRETMFELRFDGCPLWVKRATRCAVGIGAVLFFLPGVLEMLGYIPKGDYSSLGKESPCTMVGGIGLMAYSAFFAHLYSSRNSGQSAGAADR